MATKRRKKNILRELKWFWNFRVAKFFTIRYYIPHFVRNVWHFRKQLNEYRTWDYHYSLMMLHRSIELLKESITKGYEVEETRQPKVEAMEEVLYRLDRLMREVHHDEARARYNLPDQQWPPANWPEAVLIRKVYDREVGLENEDWNQIFRILRDRQTGIKTWWD